MLVDDSPSSQAEIGIQGLESGKHECKRFAREYQLYHSTKKNEVALPTKQEDESSVHEEGIFADGVCNLH